MAAPDKLTLAGLSRGDLERLAERLPAENAGLQQAVAELRAEVAALKGGLKGRPAVKPSGMERGAGPAPAGTGRGRGAKGRTTERLAVDEDRVIAAAVPAGSRFEGYADFVVQDLVLRPRVVRLRRERWLTPDGRGPSRPRCRPASSAIPGRSGAASCCSSTTRAGSPCRARLVAQLRAVGVAIPERQVVRSLTAGHGASLDEARDVLRAGLATAPWISVDDTGARHQHQNGVCAQLGDDRVAAFATTASKSRLNFLDVPRAGHGDDAVNAEALADMRRRSLAGPVVARLAAHPERRFPDAAAWRRHLERLGLTGLAVAPDPARIATEGALWGGIGAHRLLPDTGVILSDDAGPFALDRHALCWIHAERLVHRLDAFTARQHRAQRFVRALIRWSYADLKAYRREPDRRRRAAPRARFDRICRRRTGFATLDRLLARRHANKAELLLVLDRPEVPLHTNGSERDLRPQVIRRKISGGRRSEAGRDGRDAFLGLRQTCAKLGLSFWDYLGARLGVPGADAPDLPDLVRLRSAPA